MYEQGQELRKEQVLRGGIGGNVMGQTPTKPYGDQACVSPYRPGIYERIARAQIDGERAVERYQAATRAREIAEKHPEIVELLDLIGKF